MRKTFIDNLYLAAKDNPKIFLLVGDLGFSVVDKYSSELKSQFLNCGISEQNMTGIAAGLSINNYKVFTYSIGNFNTLRCLEHIRNDVCYNNLDVNIVSIGGGLGYGSAGYSHHSFEDISIMGSLPKMTLLLPGNKKESAQCLKWSLDNSGPKYIRIPKTNEYEMPPLKSDEYVNYLKINNNRLCIITYGAITTNVISAVNILEKEEFFVDLVTIPIWSKVNNKDFVDKFSKYEKLFIIEEHLEGLGLSAMIKYLLEPFDTKCFSLGLNNELISIVGDRDYLLEAHGLLDEKIAERIKKFINRG